MANHIYSSPLYFDNTNGSISSSTDASPIVVTASAAHGLKTGDRVWIAGHTTNTNANGEWIITVTSTTAFSLNGSTATGGGAGSSGTYMYGPFKNGLCELKVEGVRIVNSSGSAMDVRMYSGPTTAEFSGVASTFASIDTLTNSIELTGAGADAVAGRDLDGLLFVNNSQSPHIVGKSGSRLYLSSVAGLSTSAGWSINGREMARFKESGDGTYHYSMETCTSWPGLWITGAGSTVQVWVDLGEGSWVRPHRVGSGTVGNAVGSNTVKLTPKR